MAKGGSFTVTALKIITIVMAVIGALYWYRIVFRVVGLFFTKRFPHTDVKHKYAIAIAARNEEAVIANLIESIKRQDYPAELLTIFVVADNCTDKTATIAREAGAVCYERFDSRHCTKGYALQYLFDCIEKDYGIESFEGYFIFDADNLLKKDYLSRMNDAFHSGEKVITSYRNTKNIDDNFIAALLATMGYSLNMTIVVFDRVRENLKYYSKKMTFGEIMNASINQTLTRSINTSLTTLITLSALYFFANLIGCFLIIIATVLSMISFF